MKAQIRYQQRDEFIAEARGHKFIIDQLKEKGGDDLGMNPLEVFLSSLGGCVAFYAKRYLQQSKVSPKGLVVSIEADLCQEKPMRFKDIKVKIRLENDLGDKKEAFLGFMRNCPIHNTLTGNPDIDISF